MAPIGPLGRILAQVVVPVIAVLARALPAAYAAAVQNAKKNGAQAAAKQGVGDSAPWKRAAISRSEALQIMNLSEQEATAEAIQKQYEKYFAANAVENGGSFYLQSKIYRAKEELDEFIKEKRMEESQQGNQQ